MAELWSELGIVTWRLSRRGRLLALLCLSLFTASLHAETVVISEIMFHPRDGQPEYFVLFNNSTTPRDISGWRITEGVAFEFPPFNTNDPTAAFLRPRERIVISAATAETIRAAYAIPSAVRLFGPWKGKLNNQGERLTVHDRNGAAVCSVKFGSRGLWPAAADGGGRALVLRNPNDVIDDWRNWRASAGGSVKPGQVPVEVMAEGAAALRLNEISFAGSQKLEWVEIYNPLSLPISVDGLELTTRISRPGQRLAGTIPPQSCRSWNLAGELKEGEVHIFLRDAAREVIAAHVFAPPKSGHSWQASPDGGNEWFAADSSSRDARNHPARETNIVLNEIFFDPPNGLEGGEFIELFNRGTKEVDLSGWELEGAVKFRFPSGMRIVSDGFLVVARDTNRLRSAYGEIPLTGNFKGKLKHGGDTIRLLDGRGNLANAVRFRPGGAGIELAHGKGSSMELINAAMENSLLSSWRASDETAKTLFKTYRCTNTYLEINPLGTPSDFRELHFQLAGAGHVVLRHIGLIQNGSNILDHGEVLSRDGRGDQGWVCQGTHQASFVTHGDVHIVASGHGDERANHLEIDLPDIRPGQSCTLEFEARWLSGTPRLIAETWDHSVGGSFLLEMPQNPGTPGARNSQFTANAPPQMDELRHAPAVPRAADPVRISARVLAAAHLRSVQLFHRPDTADGSAPWQSKRMARDDISAEPIYSAIVTNYMGHGVVVQFYVEATTEEGAHATLPEGGRARPALWVVDDRRLTNDLRISRWVVSAFDLRRFAQAGTAADGGHFPRLSNAYGNATYIENEEEIFYGAQVRNSGSPRTRAADLRKPKTKLPDNRPWRGRTKFSYDDDAAHGTAYHNRVIRYLLYLLGQPAGENEFVRAVINAGPIEFREEVEPVDGEFLKRHFDRGHQGDLYRIDDEWRFTDNGEGVSADAEWSYKQSDAANRYRGEWMKRTRKTEDDYSDLIHLFRAVSAEDEAQASAQLDLTAIFQLAAVRGFVGDWDNFTMQRGRNGYLYRRPGDKRFQLLHWDGDEGFVLGQPLYGERLRPWLEQPCHRDVFIKAVREVVRLTVEEPGRFETWLRLERESHGNAILQANYLRFFKARANELREQLRQK